MHLVKYLIVGKQPGNKGSASLTAKPPALEPHEIAIKLNLEIPDTLFSKPLLEADIIIPATEVNSPKIEAEVADNIAECVQANLGISMHISIID